MPIDVVTPFRPRLMGVDAPSSGLDFQSTVDAPTSAFIAFQFLNPHLDGLPFKGPSNQGNTFMWKIRPRQQTGYYATMWWAQNDGHFTASYYGAHPYPQGGISGTVHDWEIGHDFGDTINTLSGGPHEVVKGIWHSQALRVSYNSGPNTLTFRFWIQLPSLANNDIIQVDSAPGYGDDAIPSPALTFGDSPWYPDFGHERLSGVLRGIKIFSKALTEAEILEEAGSDNVATSTGAANIWYRKINPTPTGSMLCDSGTGRNPAWAQATRANLWTGTP